MYHTNNHFNLRRKCRICRPWLQVTVTSKDSSRCSDWLIHTYIFLEVIKTFYITTYSKIVKIVGCIKSFEYNCFSKLFWQQPWRQLACDTHVCIGKASAGIIIFSNNTRFAGLYSNMQCCSDRQISIAYFYRDFVSCSVEMHLKLTFMNINVLNVIKCPKEFQINQPYTDLCYFCLWPQP